jgi:hypothetical protein
MGQEEQVMAQEEERPGQGKQWDFSKGSRRDGTFVAAVDWALQELGDLARGARGLGQE